MSRTVALCPASEIPDGTVRHFRLVDREIAVCQVEGRFYALDGRCPHQGGPLGEGTLEGDVLVCPLHGWTFSVRTGECEFMPGESVAVLPVRVEDGNLVVELD